jgi:hypothetical protein
VALSAERRIALARRGIEMYDSGDVESAIAAFHPEIEGYSETGGLNDGPFHGIEGFLRWTAQWNEAWESFDYEVEAVEAIGERHVVTVVHQTGRGRDSGIEVDQMAGYVFDVGDDGRTTYFALYLSPDRAREVAREREGLE